MRILLIGSCAIAASVALIFIGQSSASLQQNWKNGVDSSPKFGVRSTSAATSLTHQTSKPMNTGRTITSHMAFNETRRNDILEILKDGAKTAYKISLKMPGFYSTGTTVCRLRELQAAGKVTNFGDLWEIK